MADINVRAQAGGGIVRLMPNQQVNIYAGAPGAGANWFGPMAPLPPMAPPEVAGRTWDYPQAFNLQSSTDRPYQLIPFELLKNLAESYGLLRIIIETRKDQMAALEMTARPKDKDKNDTDPGLKAKIAKAKAWLEQPYPGVDWNDWLRRLMEDLFVYDAPALFPRRTKGGQLFGVKPISGRFINPLLDPWGDRPEPPNPGYVQRLKNLGAVHYCQAVGYDKPGVDASLPQLIYKPRNPRNDSPFGFGPVEQIITIINIGIRRETWQLNYFTEGNMPDALIGTPMEWTPDQLRNFQDWFDARLMGTARRHGATFVPGDVAKGYVATKDTPLFGEAEEWLARVVCFAFSISPQWATKQVNRATAHTAKATAEEEGIEPLKLWLKSLIDFIFANYLGLPDVVCDYVEEDDIDPAIQEQILTGYVSAGGITRNELRDALGKEKDPSPEADMLMVTTAAGATPLTVKDQIAAQTAKNAALPPPPGGGIGQDGKPFGPAPAPPGGPGGGSAGGGGKGGAGAGGKGGGAKTAGGKARGGAPARAAPRAQPSDARAGAKKGARAAKAAGFFTDRTSTPTRKYSDDQPRDDHGRWTGGGGATFASPSVTDKDFGGAQEALGSERQRLFEGASHDIDSQLGIQGQERSVIGAWADGAENSTMMESSGATKEQLELSAAMKGSLGDQKAVLVFSADPQGTGVLYAGEAKGSIADIHDGLLKGGIEFHTLAPTPEGARVYIADIDGSSGGAIKDYAEAHDVTFTAYRGAGSFIGGDTRAEGQAAYESVIANSGFKSHNGSDARAIWSGVRDRWADEIGAAKLLLVQKSTAGDDDPDDDDTGDDDQLDPDEEPDDDASPEDEATQEDAAFDDEEAAFSVDRAEAAEAKESFTALLEDIFGAAKEEDLERALHKINDYKDQTGQESGWDPAFVQFAAETISREMDLAGLVPALTSLHAAPVIDYLRAMMVDSSKAAIAQVGVDMTSELTDQVNEDALDYLRERGAELVGKKVIDGELVDNPDAAWSITDATRNLIKQELVRGLEDNEGEPSIANALKLIRDTVTDSYALSDARAELIAKTEIATANAAGKLNGWQIGAELQPDKSWGHAWQLSNDDNVCPLCIANHDQGTIPLDEAFESGDDAEPAHPGCLPGSARVLSRHGITAASKRWFDGDLVVIETAHGNKLSCTPNHPILTPGGWVAAGLLHIGDHVIRDLRAERIASGEIDHQDVPASIEHVAEAFGRSGKVSAVPVPTAAEDFHGDGGGSEVAIIWANRALRHGHKPARDQQRGQRSLTFGQHPARLNRLGLCQQHGLGLVSATDGGVSGGREVLALLGGSAGHAERVGVGAAPGFDAGGQDKAANHVAADADAIGDGQFGLAGDVAPDEVVSVEVFKFSGHVFTLQTGSGWYIAEGLVTRNCQCVTTLHLVSDDDSGEDDDADEGDDDE